MDPSRDEDRPKAADPAPDMSLRLRTAIADAAFVADGIALGLPRKWAEPFWPSNDRLPWLRAPRAPEDDRRAAPMPKDGRGVGANASGVAVLRPQRFTAEAI